MRIHHHRFIRQRKMNEFVGYMYTCICCVECSTYINFFHKKNLPPPQQAPLSVCHESKGNFIFITIIVCLEGGKCNTVKKWKKWNFLNDNDRKSLFEEKKVVQKVKSVSRVLCCVYYVRLFDGEFGLAWNEGEKK